MEALLRELEELPADWQMRLVESMREMLERLGEEIRRNKPGAALVSLYSRTCVRQYIASRQRAIVVMDE